MDERRGAPLLRTPTATRRSLLWLATAIGGFPAVTRLGTERHADAVDGPRRPFPQRLAYAPGTLRPDHRSQRQLDDDVRAAYDRWKAAYLVEEGDGADGLPRFRVALGKPGGEAHAVTVSEGQGFGMVVVPHLAGHDPDAQTIFDGLWRFCRDHPSAIDPRLMNWHVPPDPNGNASAFDGDCDVAYGLLLAGAQWGTSADIDYAAAARQVLASILASTIGPRSHLPMLGDWVDPDGPLYNQNTPRTSDFMPGHFRAFGRATSNPVWQVTTTSSQTESPVARPKARKWPSMKSEVRGVVWL